MKLTLLNVEIYLLLHTKKNNNKYAHGRLFQLCESSNIKNAPGDIICMNA